jgi:hypothetical protein
MSLWIDSVTVAGLTCITYGTFAQAVTSRADFKSLKGAIGRADIELRIREKITRRFLECGMLMWYGRDRGSRRVAGREVRGAVAASG